MAQNEERGADDSAYSEELSAASPNVVQGTAESMISKLENSMMSPEATAAEEGDLLQSSEPGPLDKEGKDVEDVLGIISQGGNSIALKNHLGAFLGDYLDNLWDLLAV